MEKDKALIQELESDLSNEKGINDRLREEVLILRNEWLCCMKPGWLCWCLPCVVYAFLSIG